MNYKTNPIYNRLQDTNNNKVERKVITRYDCHRSENYPRYGDNYFKTVESVEHRTIPDPGVTNRKSINI